MIRIAALVALLLLCAHPGIAVAQDEIDRPHLVQLKTRIFDIAYDKSKLLREDHHIPLSQVPWIREFLDTDPILDSAILQLEASPRPGGRYVWTPDSPGSRYIYPFNNDGLHAEGLAVYADAPLGSDRRKSILFVPTGFNNYFYAVCDDGVLGIKTGPYIVMCTIQVYYPPDPDIRISIRLYKRRVDTGTFFYMADKARRFVYCIDITEAARGVGGQAFSSGKSEEEMARCMNFSS